MIPSSLDIEARPNEKMTTSRKRWVLLNRKERWGLSGLGWLVLMAGMVLFFFIGVVAVHPFLAITETVPADVLVVEGWIHPYGIKAAATDFESGRAARIFTTGGPVSGSGGYTNDFNTSASVAGERLTAAGIPATAITIVPSHVSGRDRTYNSALALRDWLDKEGDRPQALNVLTEDVHARRTRLLFQEALGSKVKVGIIAIGNPDYDPAHWWQYSEGVREILGEVLAYAYAKLLFYPDTPAELSPASKGHEQ